MININQNNMFEYINNDGCNNSFGLCKKCGQKIPIKTANFCVFCGEKLLEVNVIMNIDCDSISISNIIDNVIIFRNDLYSFLSLIENVEEKKRVLNLVRKNFGIIYLKLVQSNDDYKKKIILAAFYTGTLGDYDDITHKESVLLSRNIKNYILNSLSSIIPIITSKLLNFININSNTSIDFTSYIKVISKQLDIDNKFYDKFCCILYKFAQFILKSDGNMTVEEENKLKEIYLELYNYKNSDAITSIITEDNSSHEQLETVLSELFNMIGIDNVKNEIMTLINFLKIQKERMNRGMLRPPISIHAVFYGPPGTGKTTTARILGKIYKCLGFLSKGHLVETDRAGIVAGYVGQTSNKVDKLINLSLDGILFIDEAYALKPENLTNYYGQEAIDILIKRMEDHRERLCVIVAGYTEEMKRFLDSNPGIKSRINRYFYFEDYKPEELLQIYIKFCNNSNYKLSESGKIKLLTLLTNYYVNRDNTFGNGRLVRNIFEKSIENHANRIAGISHLTNETLQFICDEDIMNSIT